MVTRVGRIEAVACQSRHEAAWLERSMLEHRMPPWNRTAGGQEIPIWLKVTDHGVEVDHRTVGTGVRFGPYLGATQTRNAAAALNRVYPYRYATTRSGAERDMARVRGVLPVDASRMRAAVVAVLSGDPASMATVRTELIGRRQASVDVMDFERAGTLQQQLEGLEWIVEPSRVLDSGPDLDAHGWADGLLFTFELRGGRICDWRTQPCTERNAQDRLVSTPEPWRDFATENAALAALLLSAR
jgi:excinuclease ABC subunit C